MFGAFAPPHGGVVRRHVRKVMPLGNFVQDFLSMVLFLWPIADAVVAFRIVYGVLCPYLKAHRFQLRSTSGIPRIVIRVNLAKEPQ